MGFESLDTLWGRLRPWLGFGLLFLAWGALWLGVPGPAGAETVRILVAEGRTALTLGSRGSVTLRDAAAERTLAQHGPGGLFHLTLQRGGVLVRETGRTASALVAWSPDGAHIEVDGRPFRGYLEVHATKGALSAVNVVELEDYLQGVIKDEIPAGWPAEATKAMAIAARTYALYQRGQNPAGLFHLRNTTASQVYGGSRGEDARTTWAVQNTRGQILTFQGQPIPAFYHSCSGGATEDAADYFGVEYDIILGVKDDFSRSCPTALWVERLTAGQLERALSRAGHAIGRILSVQDLIRSRTGRILRIAVQHTRGALMLEGRRFREAIGNELLRSTDFEVRGDATGFTFLGRGSGHGVGLSQWGAKEMADLAYHHLDILKFYYPLATLSALR